MQATNDNKNGNPVNLNCAGCADGANRVKHEQQVHVLLAALLFVCLAAVPLANAEAGSASNADEATVEALADTSGNAKVLSVSEQSDFFKVKVLVEGKVKVIKVPKAKGS